MFFPSDCSSTAIFSGVLLPTFLNTTERLFGMLSDNNTPSGDFTSRPVSIYYRLLSCSHGQGGQIVKLCAPWGNLSCSLLALGARGPWGSKGTITVSKERPPIPFTPAPSFYPLWRSKKVKLGRADRQKGAAPSSERPAQGVPEPHFGTWEELALDVLEPG